MDSRESRIKGENFFELEWFYQSNGAKKEVTLINIINEIKFLNQPTWDMAADDAHKIRRKRNLVHAKLCLKEEEDINEELCKKVIDYLKHVLKTRGIDSSSITIE